jgi:hypothetical protein
MTPSSTRRIISIISQVNGAVVDVPVTDNQVQNQASILAYVDVFWSFAIFAAVSFQWR